MITSVVSTEKYRADFSICTDDDIGKLWIEIKTHEGEAGSMMIRFSGNKYGTAIKCYDALQKELKERYGC